MRNATVPYGCPCLMNLYHNDNGNDDTRFYRYRYRYRLPCLNNLSINQTATGMMLHKADAHAKIIRGHGLIVDNVLVKAIVGSMAAMPNWYDLKYYEPETGRHIG